MTLWMNLLLLLMAGSLSAVAVLALAFNYRNQTRWMRIFSEKQGIPAISMEPKPKEVVIPEQPKKKVAFSMPIPGAGMFKTK